MSKRDMGKTLQRIERDMQALRHALSRQMAYETQQGRISLGNRTLLDFNCAEIALRAAGRASVWFLRSGTVRPSR